MPEPREIRPRRPDAEAARRAAKRVQGRYFRWIARRLLRHWRDGCLAWLWGRTAEIGGGEAPGPDRRLARQDGSDRRTLEG